MSRGHSGLRVRSYLEGARHVPSHEIMPGVHAGVDRRGDEGTVEQLPDEGPTLLSRLLTASQGRKLSTPKTASTSPSGHAIAAANRARVTGLW